MNSGSEPDRTPSNGWGSVSARAGGALREGAARTVDAVRARPLEAVTLLALAGGGLLVLSEFLDLYRIEAAGVPVKSQGGGEQHSYGLLVLGLAVIGAVFLARSTEQWPPAAGIVALALIALGVALFGDLPDASRSDLVRGARPAHASAAIGLWVELAGTVAALAGGVAMALLLRRR
jgi:hypothetical protein